MAGRRPGPARRVLFAVPWSRLAGAAGLVAVSAALYWVTTDRTFAVDTTAIPIAGARYTSEVDVRVAMGLPADRLVNVFRIPTGDLEARIEDLPSVRDATVVATLPNDLRVTLDERRPMLVWRAGDASWLVDGDGLAFASAAGVDPAELGTGATGTELPAVDDRRAGVPFGLGDVVPAVDLEVVRLLLTVTPDMVRTAAPELYLFMDDTDGYVLEAPGAWQAVFGPYTPVLRPPSIIPHQVQCLDALLADRDAQVTSVVLALSDETCGTFQERARPRATPRGGREDAGNDGRPRGGRSTPRP